MTLEHVIFVIALIIGLISGYTTRISARGGALFDQNMFRAAIGAAGTLALFALIIWGFINIEWYVVIGSFLVISLIVVPMAFGRMGVSMWGFWNSVQPVLDIALSGIVVWLWFGS